MACKNSNHSSPDEAGVSLHITKWSKLGSGYQYIPALFKIAITKINSSIEDTNVERVLEDVKLLLDNEDLGRAFFSTLV